MPRLQALLECVGQALCEKGRKALQGQWAFSDIMPEVMKTAHDYAHRKLPGPDLRIALGDCASVEPREYERRVGELISELSLTHAVPKAELPDYLSAVPATVRQVLRRPSDPEGRTVPDKFVVYKSEEFAVFLPPRIPRLRVGHKLEGWTLTEFRGLGQCSEVWQAEDPAQGDHSPAAIKFVTDADAAAKVKDGASLFTKTFELNGIAGILPLRSVYLEADPPCLEWPYVYGYDLAGLMFDWKWRYDSAKPEAALKLIRRLAAIVAEAHARGVVHRDLKPGSVRLRPSEVGSSRLARGFRVESDRRARRWNWPAPTRRSAALASLGTATASTRRRSSEEGSPARPTTFTRASSGSSSSSATRPRRAVGNSGWKICGRTGSPTPRPACARRASPRGRTSGRRTPRRSSSSSRVSPSPRRNPALPTDRNSSRCATPAPRSSWLPARRPHAANRSTPRRQPRRPRPCCRPPAAGRSPAAGRAPRPRRRCGSSRTQSG